jgi:hypothetical protein
VRQSRPEYLYFSPTRLSLVGVAGAVAAGAISGFALVKAWPETGIFPQSSAPAIVAAIEPERFYPVPEPESARPATRSTLSDAMETTIAAPAPIIVDHGTPTGKRMHPVSRTASNSNRHQARAVSYRRNGYYTASPGAWW